MWGVDLKYLKRSKTFLCKDFLLIGFLNWQTTKIIFSDKVGMIKVYHQ